MSIVVLVGIDPILHLLGTDESTYAYTKEYVFWIAIGATFSIFSGAFSNVIRSEGASKDAMIGHIAGSVTNIILDPILILFLNMGVAGAAIATVIGNMVACILFASYFFRKETALSIHPRDFRIPFRLAWGTDAVQEYLHGQPQRSAHQGAQSFKHSLRMAGIEGTLILLETSIGEVAVGLFVNLYNSIDAVLTGWHPRRIPNYAVELDPSNDLFLQHAFQF